MERSKRLYIFDLDGTLVDSFADIARTVNLTLQELSLRTLPEKEIIQYIGNGSMSLLGRSLQSAGADVDEILPEARKLFLPIYADNLTQNARFFPGVLDALDQLEEEGATLAICSNKPAKFMETLLKEFKQWDRFVIALGGDSLETRKPDPGPILHILKERNFRAEEAMMIGDSHYDVVAGKAAGVLTCGVTTGSHTYEELKEHTPNFIIRSFSELPALPFSM